MDFKRYFRDYPNQDGFFGPYGGMELPADLERAAPSASHQNSSVNCAVSAKSFRGVPLRFTIATAFLKNSVTATSI